LAESLIAEGANGPRICRKRSDEMVAAERLAHSAIEQAAEAIVVCDEQGRVVRASRAAADLCGRNPLRRTFDEVFALDFPSGGRAGEGKQGVRPRRMAAEVLDGKVLWAAPAMLRRPDGSQAEVLVSATALQGPDDVGCVVNLVEITELSRAQRALQESEAHFRSVLENSLDAAYRRDLQNDRFDYLSPAIQAVNGFTVEEMFAMSADEVRARTHPDDLPGLLAAVKAAERTGELRVEYRFKAKDGQYRWLADRAVMVKDENGQLRYRSGVIRDITAGMRTEKALREVNLQLAEADRRKNEFLGLLSHELRNPLTPIRNSIYILEKAVPGGPQARRALAVIDRQVGHLTQLVDDLLDVTRISRGKIRLERARLDLVEIVRRSVEDHRAFLEHHEVGLELPSDPISVDGDPTRLGQVIGNLLINAAKFTPEKGKVVVGLRRTLDSAVLEVADTGVGIDADTLKRLFQPFAQAERSLSQSRGGMGLGLALVKGLVELHGGAVSAHSDGPGRGARFTVRLPLEDRGAVAGREQIAKGVSAGKRKVLVIEDNADAATHMREALEHWDHAVEVACSGPEGLEKARQFDPDFVLCALRLHGMDGYDVARAFRADAQLKDVHLVATSNGAPPDMERAAEAGFERHLRSPSSAEAIDEILRAMSRPGGGRNRSGA